MNQRIRELIQSTVATLDRGPLDRSQDTDAILREFAELIVRESIEVMKRHDYHGEWLGKKIREHFGVEE